MSEHSAENDARRFGMGHLKDPSFAVNVQADRCGFYASIVLGRRIFWCVIPPKRVEVMRFGPPKKQGGGCDCTTLCSMGPTCPGGMLAGLSGSGCPRVFPPADGGTDV